MTRRSRIVSWCVSLSLLTAASAARATMIVGNPNNPQPFKHDRFYVGEDKAFIGDPYNFSGVGRVDVTGTSSRWVTMISPSYFLSAKHYRPENGATVKFYHTNDPDGATEQRTVVSGVQISGSDVWLGKLSSPVSSGVAKYPLLDFPDYSDYDDIEIFTFGLSVDWNQGTATTVRLGRNEINPGEYGSDPPGKTGEYYLYEYDDPGLGDDESYFRIGDSGGASFHVYEGQPALTGIHWFTDGDGEGIGRDYSGDSFLKPYVAGIQAAMVGERLSVFPTPPDAWTWDNQGGAGNSHWEVAANWNPAQLPGPLSVSTIGNGDAVTLDAAAESAEVVLNHSELHVTDVGALTVGDVVLVGPASLLTVDGSLSATTVSVHGTLTGSGEITAGPIGIVGHVAPGMGVGTLTVIDAAVVLDASATYDAEVSLATAGAGADQIELSGAGSLQLGGTLAVAGVDRGNADWAADVSRRIVNGAVMGTEFDTVTPVPGTTSASHVGQGAFLRDVNPAPDGVDLELFVALGGDTNGDGDVWTEDWTTFRSNFSLTGSGKGWTEGNFDPWNNDRVWTEDWTTFRSHFSFGSYIVAEGGAAPYGDGDLGDYPISQAGFGDPVSSESPLRTADVPEPTALVILLGAGLLGIGALVRRRRRTDQQCD